ncbi:MAG TPA: vWA domain-containing protein [Dactylosporangium sp.]|nr:vWA domain-containing protein [Dactylosporangium sp.]
MRAGQVRARAAAVVLALVAATMTVVAGPQPASAFGTIGTLGQNWEHERITRLALGCAPKQRSTGDCFEPRSLSQLAGHLGTFGAVGAPDRDQVLDSSAHCDDADYLDKPGYPQSRQQATAALAACIEHLRLEFGKGVDAAGKMLDAGGNLVPKQAQLHGGCSFDHTYTDIAKCSALEGFGRALHGAQDFYSHSNWADESDPDEPISETNPPGLNRTDQAPFLNLTVNGPIDLSSLPAKFTTGYYSLGTDYCTPFNSRIRHACLNKDKAVIDNSGFATDPGTARGQVLKNEQKAVSAAIAETARQWRDFRALLRTTYGNDKANRIIMAMTQDVTSIDLVFAIDTTSSMSPYINATVGAAGQLVDLLAGAGTSSRPTDFRVGLVDYKDVDSSGCAGSYDAQTDLEFSSDRNTIINALGKLPAKVSGGCDIPEDVYSGVDRAIGFPWRPGVKKVVVVMGDAPGHDPEAHSSLTLAKVVQHALEVDPAVVYPILVGGNSSATTFFTALADGTGGKTFDSRSGGVPAALLAAVDEIVLSPEPGDQDAPVVKTTFPAPPGGPEGFFTGPVSGTVTATDPSGVSAIDCRDSSGTLTQGPLTISGNTASRTLKVTGDGEHIVDCVATDKAPLPNRGVGEDSSGVIGFNLDATPPKVTCSASPATLDPADGRLVTITATVKVEDALSGPAGFTLTSVTSNQSDTAADDIAGFATGTADTTGQLRATDTGSGRRYTLTYRGRDTAGNAAECQAFVIVGHPTGPSPSVSATPGGGTPTPGASGGSGAPMPVTGPMAGTYAFSGLFVILAGALLVTLANLRRRHRGLHRRAG